MRSRTRTAPDCLRPSLYGAARPGDRGVCGPLGAYLVRHGFVRKDATQRIVNMQGVTMGRPSRMHIAIGGTPERITGVRVGGEAVLVARGELVI